MMKKLLILMLVFGLASSASALTVTLDPSGNQGDTAAGVQSLDVVSDSILPYEYFLTSMDITYGDITSIAVQTAAGDDATATNLGPMAGYAMVWSVNALDTGEPFNTVPGVHFTASVNFTGAADGEDLTIELLNGALQTLDSVTYEGVPEPMTIALLGLGGLLLRRRK